MKTIALLVLALCLPVFADDFAVTLDKDGALSVGGKKVSEEACAESFKAAADKCRDDAISRLQLAILCAPETPWGAVQNRINQAAEACVWDIRLKIGDKTVWIPLPKDSNNPDIFFPDEDEDGKNGDKKVARRIPNEIRVIVWTGESGDIVKDSAAAAAKDVPGKDAVKTWARVNKGPSTDISAKSASVVDSVRELLKEEEEAGTEDPVAVIDVAASVATKHVFALIAALRDSAKGAARLEFATPVGK